MTRILALAAAGCLISQAAFAHVYPQHMIEVQDSRGVWVDKSDLNRIGDTDRQLSVLHIDFGDAPRVSQSSLF